VGPGIPTLVSGGEGGALESLPWFQLGRVGPWNPYLGFRWGGWALEFTAVKCAWLAGVAAGLQAGTLRPVQITPNSPI
jgi:hypothetical protein